MFNTIKEPQQELDWNVLTNRWLDVMNFNGEIQVWSPLEVLEQANEIRCITEASPLDFFAVHRFLLTLVYWKAGEEGGVQQVRESLLKGEIPRSVLDAIRTDSSNFRLFDREAPFMQDPSVENTKKQEWKSVGSPYAEFATGTNIAHFHHGDDQNMRLCLRCMTICMLRLVPWSQAGGRGLTPAIHGAPPIVVIASGSNLAVTLGLNLVPLPVRAGSTIWTGNFVPTDKDTEVPYLEAFTWNPRRIHLRALESANCCWRCGQKNITAVGQIVYKKNEKTKANKEKDKTIPFIWHDPAAFYSNASQYKTIKSSNEARAAKEQDLNFLLNQEELQKPLVIDAISGHDIVSLEKNARLLYSY